LKKAAAGPAVQPDLEIWIRKSLAGRTQAFLRQHGKPCLATPFSLQEFRRAVAAAVQ